ncbi:MAG TPA: hypothetical protein VLS90_08480, partial [Thermodesulfobacteriota bacterium]|nr:hypothetical protein [Thermodesulfobacteriota bacterium]
MKRVVAAGFFLLFIAFGYDTPGTANGPGAVPEITHAFASTQVWPGQTWRIYLKVSDPDGD